MTVTESSKDASGVNAVPPDLAVQYDLSHSVREWCIDSMV